MKNALYFTVTEQNTTKREQTLNLSIKLYFLQAFLTFCAKFDSLRRKKVSKVVTIVKCVYMYHVYD